MHGPAALLSLLLSAAPLATGETGNPHLRGAMEQVRSMNEGAGLKSLELAARWSGNGLHDLALIQLWMGLAYAGLSEEAKARRAFEAALRLEPGLPLPEQTSPRVSAWWKAIRDQLAPPPPVLTPPAPAPPAALALPPPTERPVASTVRRATGTGLLILGAVGMGTAAYLGLRAGATHQSAVREPAVGAAVALQSTAEGEARASTVLLGAGGAALLAGGVVWSFEWW